MAKYDGYHTALADPGPYRARASYAAGRYGIALQYDLMDMAPSEAFAQCDVFYSDLPWRSGFDTFEARAGKGGRAYADFLAAAKWHVETFAKPTVFVTGKHALAALNPELTYETRLNGAPALAMCWGLRLADTSSEHAILAEIAARFGCLGDYCCGYGRTGRYAINAGKRYVMSDMNEHCIAYIGDKL